MNYVKDSKNSYLRKRELRMKNLFRLYLGLQQLIYRPYINVAVIMVIVLFALGWIYKDRLIIMENLSPISHIIMQHCTSITLVLLELLSFYEIIQKLGEMAARHDESCLIVAFKASDLQNGYPILITKKKIKNTDVTVREFYTNISMSRWREMQEEISDAMNIHFVTPYMEYGGKNKDNGKRIIIYTAPTRKATRKEILYDTEI